MSFLKNAIIGLAIFGLMKACGQYQAQNVLVNSNLQNDVNLAEVLNTLAPFLMLVLILTGVYQALKFFKKDEQAQAVNTKGNPLLDESVQCTPTERLNEPGTQSTLVYEASVETEAKISKSDVKQSIVLVDTTNNTTYFVTTILVSIFLAFIFSDQNDVLNILTISSAVGGATPALLLAGFAYMLCKNKPYALKVFIGVNFVILSASILGNLSVRSKSGGQEQTSTNSVATATRTNVSVKTAIDSTYDGNNYAPVSPPDAMAKIKNGVNSSEDLYYLGHKAYIDKDFRNAFLSWIEAASNGHPKAQYELAVMYIYGDYVARDLRQASYWLESAARLNVRESQSMYGTMLSTGDETPGAVKNIKRAYVWYSVAAKNGDIVSVELAKELLPSIPISMQNELKLEADKLYEKVNQHELIVLGSRKHRSKKYHTPVQINSKKG